MTYVVLKQLDKQDFDRLSLLENCGTMEKISHGGVEVKYIKQVLIVLCFSCTGQILEYLIPLPVPAAIYGFVLLFAALCTGILKQEHIAETADFLISGMGILFVAPAVNILAYYDIIAPQLAKVCLVVVLSTAVVFAVSGWVTQWLRKKEEKDG